MPHSGIAHACDALADLTAGWLTDWVRSPQPGRAGRPRPGRRAGGSLLAMPARPCATRAIRYEASACAAPFGSRAATTGHFTEEGSASSAAFRRQSPRS